MDRLSGKDKKILDKALLSAFPNYAALKRMVMFQLNENLEKIVSEGRLDNVVFDLLSWAEKEGKLRQLIEGAYKINPSNQELIYFYETIFPKYFPVKQSSSNKIISEEQKNELIDILAETFSGFIDNEMLKIILGFTKRLTETKYVTESVKSRIKKWREKIPFQESIVSITSSYDRKANVIGTGFAFHREQNFTYLLTCPHVVEDMGGKNNVLVDNIPAEIVAIGDIRGFDLAILRVAEFDHIPLLKLTILSPETE